MKLKFTDSPYDSNFSLFADRKRKRSLSDSPEPEKALRSQVVVKKTND